jgi:hypothetical protein
MGITIIHGSSHLFEVAILIKYQCKVNRKKEKKKERKNETEKMEVVKNFFNGINK